MNLTRLGDALEGPRFMRVLTEAADSLVYDMHRKLGWKDYAKCALSQNAVEAIAALANSNPESALKRLCDAGGACRSVITERLPPSILRAIPPGSSPREAVNCICDHQVIIDLAGAAKDERLRPKDVLRQPNFGNALCCSGDCSTLKSRAIHKYAHQLVREHGLSRSSAINEIRYVVERQLDQMCRMYSISCGGGNSEEHRIIPDCIDVGDPAIFKVPFSDPLFDDPLAVTESLCRTPQCTKFLAATLPQDMLGEASAMDMASCWCGENGESVLQDLVREAQGGGVSKDRLFDQGGQRRALEGHRLLGDASTAGNLQPVLKLLCCPGDCQGALRALVEHLSKPSTTSSFSSLSLITLLVGGPNIGARIGSIQINPAQINAGCTLAMRFTPKMCDAESEATQPLSMVPGDAPSLEAVDRSAALNETLLNESLTEQISGLEMGSSASGQSSDSGLLGMGSGIINVGSGAGSNASEANTGASAALVTVGTPLMLGVGALLMMLACVVLPLRLMQGRLSVTRRRVKAIELKVKDMRL